MKFKRETDDVAQRVKTAKKKKVVANVCNKERNRK